MSKISGVRPGILLTIPLVDSALRSHSSAPRSLRLPVLSLGSFAVHPIHPTASSCKLKLPFFSVSCRSPPPLPPASRTPLFLFRPVVRVPPSSLNPISPFRRLYTCCVSSVQLFTLSPWPRICNALSQRLANLTSSVWIFCSIIPVHP